MLNFFLEIQSATPETEKNFSIGFDFAEQAKKFLAKNKNKQNIKHAQNNLCLAFPNFLEHQECTRGVPPPTKMIWCRPGFFVKK